MPNPRRFALALFAVALPAGSAFGAPPTTAATAPAPTTAPAPAPAPAPVPTQNAPATTTGMTASDRQASAMLDRHIAALHRQLGITEAQEPAWKAFTDVMGANMNDMNSRLAQRQSAFGSLNAVDDLRSYADIENARAAGIGRLVGPFSALYAELSPTQKATADRIFHAQTERHARHAGG